MKLKHTTTTAVQAAAKKGLSLVDGKKVDAKKVSDLAVAGAKKIASGQKLSDEHVRAMEEYHHTHAGSCPTDPSSADAAEDLMWGGPAGAMWAGTRVAAMDAEVLADESIDLNKLFESGTALSFEIFGNTDGEKIELDDGEDGLLWAPILRSGTLAVRPGPNGQKVAEPLVFVAGHSSDARKEIGLEDLLDAFNANAVQHVTIPTSHQNGVLENTGFIKAMKMADSTMRPGEKVLMGGHDFTEPDVKDKVGRGTIANRSCGILYDYTNTETGATFGAVVEHVCLTNRPFVPGMEPYGALEDLDFSDRTVVPLMLSEINPGKEKRTSVDTWDGNTSRFTDDQYKESCLLDRKNGKPVKERFSLPVREPDGSLSEQALEIAAVMIGRIPGVSLEDKRSTAKQIGDLYREIDKSPPHSIAKMAAVSTAMSDEVLRAELQLADVAWGDGISLNDMRGQIVEKLREMRQSPQDEYGGPHFYVEDVQANPYKARVSCDYGDYLADENDDNWVVPFTVDDTGKVELGEFGTWEPVKQEWVVDEPTRTERDELNNLLNTPSKNPPSATLFDDLPADPLERAAHERLALSREQPITNTTGGRSMSRLTREQIGAMELSDENRAILLADVDERERDAQELLTRREKDKEGEVKTYLEDLSKKGFEGHPGFLREVERALLADDGKPITRLDLSDTGGTKDQLVTASELVKRIVDAIPLSDDGKSKPAPELRPSLLTSPIDSRPPVEREDPEKDANKPVTGTELAQKWEKDLGGSLELSLAPEPGTPAATPAG